MPTSSTDPLVSTISSGLIPPRKPFRFVAVPQTHNDLGTWEHDGQLFEVGVVLYRDYGWLWKAVKKRANDWRELLYSARRISLTGERFGHRRGRPSTSFPGLL